jgi:uncharacterized membrane protein YoaK (UPF0700 family)
VLLLAGTVRAASPPLAQLLSIPVFAVAVAMACLVARRAVPRLGRGVLLVAQATLLFLVLTLALQPREQSVVAAMAAVGAMAFQNAFIQVSLHVSWSTSVMTGNVVTAIGALVQILGPPSGTREESLHKLRVTTPLILGFMAGCLVGATVASRLGPWAWGIPAALSVVAAGTGARAPGPRPEQSQADRDVARENGFR